MRTVSLVAVGVIVALGVSARAEAVVCPVPTGSQGTIQDAVDDIGCTEITLGIQAYTESVMIDRSLTISGVSSTSSAIAGRVAVVGSSTVFSLANLQVDGSHSSVAGFFVEALSVSPGAVDRLAGIGIGNGVGIECAVVRRSGRRVEPTIEPQDQAYRRDKGRWDGFGGDSGRDAGSHG